MHKLLPVAPLGKRFSARATQRCFGAADDGIASLAIGEVWANPQVCPTDFGSNVRMRAALNFQRAKIIFLGTTEHDSPRLSATAIRKAGDGRYRGQKFLLILGTI